MRRKIVVKNLEKPKEKDLDEDITWICDSLGLMSGRDIKATAAKIMADLLDRYADEGATSSKKIAKDLRIPSSRVNHHVRNLIKAGVLYRNKHRIFLRGGSLKSAVEEMRKDANRLFDEIEEIAEDIDSTLGFKNR